MEQNTFLITESELQQLDILSQKFDSRALFILLHAARSRPGVPAPAEQDTAGLALVPDDDPPDTFEPITTPQETAG